MGNENRISNRCKGFRKGSKLIAVLGTLALVNTGLLNVPARAAEPAGYYTSVPQSELQAIWVDSTENNEGQDGKSGPLDRVLDGNNSTFWHSRWNVGTGPVEIPHEFIIGTKSGKAVENVGQIYLTTRKDSSGSGRFAEFEVFTRADSKCENVTDGWISLGKKEVPAIDKGDQTLQFKPQPISCIKVKITKAWDGSNNSANPASLAEFNLQIFNPGEKPFPKAAPLPAGTPEHAYKYADNARSATEILKPLALDDRLADNRDNTPIALKIPGWNGQDRVVGARPSTTSPVAQGSAKGKDYFVDCVDSALNPGQEIPVGTGSKENPFKTLAQVNNHADFLPGDRILFKRGTVCPGLLHAKGSGEAGKPIIIDAYGDANAPLPQLQGRGINEDPATAQLPKLLVQKNDKGVESAVVRFFNQQHWVVRNLEISNYSGTNTDYKDRRRGVVVAAEDFGEASGFEISDLYIHDVLGAPDKDLGGSGGIQFEAYAGAAKKPTSFTNLHVHHNVIKHVSRSGINEGSNFRNRPSVGGTSDNPFQVWGGMEVHDNILSDLGGDAIVTQFASNTKVYNNTAWNVANHHGGKAPAGNNAALWPWDADNVHYYNNHVFATQMPAGTWDSTAFDADYGTTGTLFEYNITHDNEGGFMLFCGCGGLSTQTKMRYNLSLNDGRGGEHHDQGPRVFFVAGQTDGEVYNNTFLVYPGATIDKGSSASSSLVYQNNVFLAQGEVKTTFVDNLAKTSPFLNNLFAGSASIWPDAKRNLVKPDLFAPQATGLAALQLDKAEVKELGYPIVKTDVTDIVGHPVPKCKRPDLGAFQVSEVKDDVAINDGGFERGTAAEQGGWNLSAGAQIDQKIFAHGTKSLYLPTEVSQASQQILAGTNYTYRLTALVKVGENGKNPRLRLTNLAGHTVEAQPDGKPENGWQPVSLVMRTSWDKPPINLDLSILGAGYVDDISLIPIKDYVVDGSFQATANTPWTNNWGMQERTNEAVSGARSVKLTNQGSTENRETVVDNPQAVYQLIGWGKTSAGNLRIGAKFPGTEVKEVHGSFVEDRFVQKTIDFTPTINRFTVYCYKLDNGVGQCDDISVVKKWDTKVKPVDPDFRVTPPAAPGVSVGTQTDPLPAPAPSSETGTQTDPLPTPAPGVNTGTQTDPLPKPDPTPNPNPEPAPNPIPGSGVVPDGASGDEEIVRIAGKDRVETSIAAFERLRSNYPSRVMVLAGAQGEGYVDALAAASVAESLHTGVVITSGEKLADPVRTIILKHGITRVVIAGGASHISKAVEQELYGLGVIQVVRLAGQDRYETAARLASFAADQQGKKISELPVILADGTTSSDSLVSGALVGKLKGVLLLTQNGMLPPATAKLLSNHHGQIVAVGGLAAKGAKIIGSDQAASLVELVGQDRYETSALVLSRFFADASHVLVVNGQIAADAVVASAYGAVKIQPVVLTNQDHLPAVVRKALPTGVKIILVGGSASISDQVAK